MNSQELELMKDLLEEKLISGLNLDKKTTNLLKGMLVDVYSEIEYNKEMLTNELKQ